MLRIDLERDDASACAQAPRHPDGAVAAECSDFEDRTRANQLREHLQQLALVGRYRDWGQSGSGAAFQRRFEDWIVAEQVVGKILIDFRPPRLDGAGSSASSRRAGRTPSRISFLF